MSRTRTGDLLDDTTRAIVEQLQADGRRSFAAIGKAVSLSQAATRERVHRLISQGALQIVAITDPLQLGFARQAMIGIKVSGDVEAVAEQLIEISEIVYLVVTAGTYDLLVEVVVVDDEHLLELVNQRIRSIDGVMQSESFLYLRLMKQTYNWGTRPGRTGTAQGI